MIVRDLRAEDRPGWDGLWSGYIAFYNESVADEVTELTFVRLLDPNEPMFGLVAEHEGALIGIVNCVLHRGTWTMADHCYLEDLFVLDAARGLGAGRALIEAVYKRADELGAGRVYWLTRESNTTARALYDKVALYDGFIQYRRP